MKLTLAPITACVMLALSTHADSFEVVKKHNPDKQNKIAAAKNQKTLKLGAAEFDPVFEKLILPGWTEKSSQVSQMGLIQFFSNDDQVKYKIKQAGAEIVGYLPDDTYIVKWHESSQAKLNKDSSFRYVGAYKDVYKLSPHLWDAINDKNKSAVNNTLTIELIGTEGSELADLTAVVSKFSVNAEITLKQMVKDTPRVRAVLNQNHKSSVLNMLQSQNLIWVDVHRPNKINNIDSVGPIQSGENDISQATIWNKGLIGTGQVVAVADSGVDRNQAFFSQYNSSSGGGVRYTDAINTPNNEVPELQMNNKIVGYFVQPGATAYDDDEECSDDSGRSGYHGTHVAGTVAGDSGTAATATNANYDNGDGMAPHAQILVQDLGNSQSGCLEGVGGYGMFVQAHEAGAGISSNSYGVNALERDNDFYFFNDQEVDRASYDIEDLIIVFSAGNDGNAGIGHPGQSKNALTVGALGHGSSTSVVGFSSRGPTFDGRRKPDIVAPGAGIISAAGNADNTNPPSQSSAALSSKSGTSMAAPTVSGGLALMRQYFMEGFYPSGTKNNDDVMQPSGSLLKSTVLNGTFLLSRPLSIDQGYGRIFLDNSLYFNGDSQGLRVWDLPRSNGLSTGEEMSFKVKVNAGEAFRTTLSWFDPPASIGTGLALVNDLDLEVRFNGQVYSGNNWSRGESITGERPDTRNNVEQIHLAAPSSGTYEIIVKGTQVNGIGSDESFKQGFALVSSQAQCQVGVSAANSFSLSESSSGAPEVSVNSAAGSYQVYRKPGSCSSSNTGYRFIGQVGQPTGQTSFLDLGTEGGNDYSYAIKRVDTCGEAAYSSCKTIRSNAACNSSPQFNSDGLTVSGESSSFCSAELKWPSASSSCEGAGTIQYNIYRSDQQSFTPSAENRVASGVRKNDYTDFTVSSNETYHYIVTAVDALGNESLNRNVVSIFTTGDEFVAGDYVDDPDVQTAAVLQDPWQITSTNASTGTQSFHNATDRNNYLPNTCAYLTLPELEIQAGATLNYDVLYNLEVNWDGVVVQISDDGGETWNDLPPNGGYPSDFSATSPQGTPVNECGFPATQGAFSGSQNSFTTFSTDLAAYAGKTAIVRWAFSSDPGSQEDGFYLDNINIENSSSPGVCSVNGLNKDASGPWYNADQSGHGLFLEVSQGGNNAVDRITSYWYAYLDGQPRWLFGTGSVDGNFAEIDMFTTSGGVAPPNFNPDDVTIEPWGKMSIDFENQNQGLVSWDSVLPGFGSGSMPMSKLALVSDSPKSCYSGSYSNPQQPGHGYVVEIIGEEGNEVVLMTWYNYDNDGNQIWLIGTGALNGTTATNQVLVYEGSDFPPEFVASDVSNQQWGTLNVDFGTLNQLTVAWEADLAGFSDGEIIANKFTELKGRACY